jgi:hypothetical protein
LDKFKAKFGKKIGTQFVLHPKPMKRVLAWPGNIGLLRREHGSYKTGTLFYEQERAGMLR